MFQYDELNDLRRTFDEYSEKQKEVRKAYDPQTLQANLKVAAQQAEEEAETIAEEFIEGMCVQTVYLLVFRCNTEDLW